MLCLFVGCGMLRFRLLFSQGRGLGDEVSFWDNLIEFLW